MLDGPEAAISASEAALTRVLAMTGRDEADEALTPLIAQLHAAYDGVDGAGWVMAVMGCIGLLCRWSS